MSPAQQAHRAERNHGPVVALAFVPDLTPPVAIGSLERALAVHAPTYEETAVRAYGLWEASGGASSPEQNWFEAERQLWDEYWNGAPAPQTTRLPGGVFDVEH